MRHFARWKALLSALICLASLSISCSRESIKLYRDLIPLRAALIRQYGEQNVNLLVHNTDTLDILFINSSFNGLERPEKELKAQEIARFVKRNYASIDHISTIRVAFVIHQSYFIFFQYNNAQDTFIFAKNRLSDTGEFENLSQIFEAGNNALLAKRYDDAISQFDHGLALAPQAPGLLVNKSVALRIRGAERFNLSIKLSDRAAREAGLDAARQDIRQAAELATAAVNLVKSTLPRSALMWRTQPNPRLVEVLAARAEAMRLLATIVDKTQADAAFAAIEEYIAVEANPVRRSQAQLGAAKTLLDAGEGAKAATEYQKILRDDPANLDATLGVGLALFQTGDKTKYPEAAKYLQRFVERAPDQHPLKASAQEALDYLRTQGGSAASTAEHR